MRSLKMIAILSMLVILFFIYGCSQPVPASKAGENDVPAEASHVLTAPVSQNSKQTNTAAEKIDTADAPLPIAPSIKESIKKEPEKAVFLTFDDGPSIITPEFLDVLKSNGVQATFCVIGTRAETYPDIIKKEYAEGNSVINHSYDHISADLYVTPGTVMESIKKCNDCIDSIIDRTSIEKSFVRLPGGTHIPFVIDHRDELIPLLKEGSYNTLDWNVSSGDCDTGSASVDYISKNAEKGIGSASVVILMHDFKYRATTLQALPEIIKAYKDNGYTFKTIRGISLRDIENLKSKKVIDMMY